MLLPGEREKVEQRKSGVCGTVLKLSIWTRRVGSGAFTYQME